MKKTITVLNLCAMLLALSFSVHAQDNFFQGKSVRVIRGGQPGDLYDLWTRHIATYLGKHIPGNPSVTVQNMPGAGSVIAANYVYNVAKPDGLTLGSINSGYLHGSTDWPQRSPVRLGEVQLDRHAGADRIAVFLSRR